MSKSNNDLEYVGHQACISCHDEQVKQWQQSHHKQAMQYVNEDTVLGDFNNKTFEKIGLVTTFYKKQIDKENQYWVNTDGPDGQLADYQIKYTFGVYPLQQYMIQFPKGRIQVLDIARDSRSKEEGGQRWFSLHPDDSIQAGDVLHWTGPNLNWNYMCADCHSTNLKKNYSEIDKAYTTQWDAINVSCEACHGPASQHVKLFSENKEGGKTKGLTINFISVNDRHWRINPETRKPFLAKNQLSKNKSKPAEVEVCAKCHSRRAQIDDNFVPGDNFRDHYLPALLTDSLYYHDGKIKDEVYVYGSFMQSKMYQAGVICSDCHDMHSLQLKVPGQWCC